MIVELLAKAETRVHVSLSQGPFKDAIGAVRLEVPSDGVQAAPLIASAKSINAFGLTADKLPDQAR
jgi:hypothetical protein